MSLSRAPVSYSGEEQDRIRAEIARMDGRTRKKGQDIEVAGTERLILSSVNGTRFKLVVSNAGALSAVAI